MLLVLPRRLDAKVGVHHNMEPDDHKWGLEPPPPPGSDAYADTDKTFSEKEVSVKLIPKLSLTLPNITNIS